MYKNNRHVNDSVCDSNANNNILNKIRFNKLTHIIICISCFLLISFVLFKINYIFEIICKVLSISAPIIYGIAFAYLINPLMQCIEDFLVSVFKYRFKQYDYFNKIIRYISILFANIIVVIVIVVIFKVMMPYLYSNIRALICFLPKQWCEFEYYVGKFIIKHMWYFDEKSMYYIINYSKECIIKFFNNFNILHMKFIAQNIINLFSKLFNIIVGLIIAIYILASKEKLIGKSKKVIYAIIKIDRANFVLNIIRKINENFNIFLISKIIDSIIIGIICFIGMNIFKFTDRYTVLISVVVCITNVIPFLGPYIGAIPSILLIMLENPINGLYFVIFIFILQQIDGNIIGPKIMGRSMGLSALLIIVSILIGGGMFGFIGMIIGVPIFSTIYYFLQIKFNKSLKDKNLPINSEEYRDVYKINNTENNITLKLINSDKKNNFK